jgi:hypothetical protein
MRRLEGGGCNFVLGCLYLKDAPKEVGVSRVKDLEKLLEAFVTIAVGRSNVDPSLLSKMEVFIKKKKCKRALCIRKGWHSFTSSYANDCQAPYFKFENVKQGSQRVVGWDGPKKTPNGHVMHYKQLKDINLHTFVGMVGY